VTCRRLVTAGASFDDALAQVGALPPARAAA
ncbi:MAG: hypothetical protein JWQ53_1872, partial [Klenkia sp.]|nr:hypothetical protein [Klenkia sp.]